MWIGQLDPGPWLILLRYADIGKVANLLGWTSGETKQWRRGTREVTWKGTSIQIQNLHWRDEVNP